MRGSTRWDSPNWLNCWLQFANARPQLTLGWWGSNTGTWKSFMNCLLLQFYFRSSILYEWPAKILLLFVFDTLWTASHKKQNSILFFQGQQAFQFVNVFRMTQQLLIFEIIKARFVRRTFGGKMFKTRFLMKNSASWRQLKGSNLELDLELDTQCSIEMSLRFKSLFD